MLSYRTQIMNRAKPRRRRGKSGITRRLRFAAVICLCIVLISGCGEPEGFLVPNGSGPVYVTDSDNFGDIFETFWSAMNVNYTYWDVEPDGYWDAVHNTYRPLFDALGDYKSEEAKSEAVKYFRELLMPLHDGHLSFNLDYKYNDNGTSKNYINPGKSKVKARYDSRPKDEDPYGFFPVSRGNFEKTISKYAITGESDFSDTIHLGRMKIDITGTRDDTGDYISYLCFSDFQILDYFTGSSTLTITPAEVPRVFNKYLEALGDINCKGVIIDIRGNPGGSTADIPFVLSPLLKEDVRFAYCRYKNGFGRLDYAPRVPFIIPAAPPEMTLGGRTYHRWANAGEAPVVVLCNDDSISCAELTTLAVKTMPNGYVTGTRTYGALGLRRTDSDTPVIQMGGPFTHNKFWTSVTLVSQQTCGPDYENYDGLGIEPDETVAFSKTKFEDGHDPQLLAAIRHIDPGHPDVQ